MVSLPLGLVFPFKSQEQAVSSIPEPVGDEGGAPPSPWIAWAVEMVLTT